MKKSIFFSAVFFFAFSVFVNASGGDGGGGTGKNADRVSIVVFPNPVLNIVTVSFGEPLEQPIVETFNVNGQSIAVPSNSQGDGSNKMEVDLSGLAPGIYFLKVFSNKELIGVQQIIKQ